MTSNNSSLLIAPQSIVAESLQHTGAIKLTAVTAVLLSLSLQRVFTFSLGLRSRQEEEGFRNFVQSQRGAE